MNKKIIPLVLAGFMSVSLFAKDNYRLDKKDREEGPTIIQNFYKEPFIKDNQIKALELIKSQSEYRTNKALIALLKEVYIYSDDIKVSSQADGLWNNNVYIKEKVITDKTTGKTKVKKINTRSLEKKFENIKNSLSSGMAHLLYLEKKDKKTEAEEIYFTHFERFGHKILKIPDTAAKLAYMTSKGNYEEANKFFTTFVENKYEKLFAHPKKQPTVKDELKYKLGDIYSYGAFLNYNNKELLEKYKQRANYFYKDSPLRTSWILAKELRNQEKFEDSAYYYSELRENIEDIVFTNQLLESYYKATRQSLLNKEYNSAWINARKALLLRSEVTQDMENRRKYLPVLLELKRYLKDSSLLYIKELIDRGEHAHASRVKQETLKLLSVKLMSI